MAFVHWIRSDSQENFFSCSDVAFDGGDATAPADTGQSPAAASAGAGAALTAGAWLHLRHRPRPADAPLTPPR
ncbi:hypothetical protein [Streptomyces sp. VRA16 Mangrove soil]|uniref:hypothetical protein n=1 Tax=Streptomyces sp. VRA16 Mangrove soil TaxID=2817434 RepID=UPI0035ABAA38